MTAWYRFHVRFHLTPVVRSRNNSVCWLFTRRLDWLPHWNTDNSSSSRVKSTLGCADGDWSYLCIFTLPTPPMQKNCHSDFFLDQWRVSPPSFGQSPPITEGLLFDAYWKSWAGTMDHFLIRWPVGWFLFGNAANRSESDVELRRA